MTWAANFVAMSRLLASSWQAGVLPELMLRSRCWRCVGAVLALFSSCYGMLVLIPPSLSLSLLVMPRDLCSLTSGTTRRGLPWPVGTSIGDMQRIWPSTRSIRAPLEWYVAEFFFSSFFLFFSCFASSTPSDCGLTAPARQARRREGPQGRGLE